MQPVEVSQRLDVLVTSYLLRRGCRGAAEQFVTFLDAFNDEAGEFAASASNVNEQILSSVDARLYGKTLEQIVRLFVDAFAKDDRRAESRANCSSYASLSSVHTALQAALAEVKFALVANAQMPCGQTNVVRNAKILSKTRSQWTRDACRFRKKPRPTKNPPEQGVNSQKPLSTCNENVDANTNAYSEQLNASDENMDLDSIVTGLLQNGQFAETLAGVINETTQDSENKEQCAATQCVNSGKDGQKHQQVAAASSDARVWQCMYSALGVEPDKQLDEVGAGGQLGQTGQEAESASPAIPVADSGVISESTLSAGTEQQQNIELSKKRPTTKRAASPKNGADRQTSAASTSSKSAVAKCSATTPISAEQLVQCMQQLSQPPQSKSTRSKPKKRPDQSPTVDKSSTATADSKHTPDGRLVDKRVSSDRVTSPTPNNRVRTLSSHEFIVYSPGDVSAEQSASNDAERDLVVLRVRDDDSVTATPAASQTNSASESSSDFATMLDELKASAENAWNFTLCIQVDENEKDNSEKSGRKRIVNGENSDSAVKKGSKRQRVLAKLHGTA